MSNSTVAAPIIALFTGTEAHHPRGARLRTHLSRGIVKDSSSPPEQAPEPNSEPAFVEPRMTFYGLDAARGPASATHTGLATVRFHLGVDAPARAQPGQPPTIWSRNACGGVEALWQQVARARDDGATYGLAGVVLHNAPQSAGGSDDAAVHAAHILVWPDGRPLQWFASEDEVFRSLAAWAHHHSGAAGVA